MRIVMSDYDGTLYHDGALLGDVPTAIRDWRAAGNRFGIATGRDFSMIQPELARWGLTVDCLVCINGAAVYDSTLTLIGSHLLEDRIIPEILRHPAGMASQHYQFSGLGPLRVFLRPGSFFWDAGITFQEVDLDTALRVTGIGQISLAYPTEDESVKWAAALMESLGDHIEAHRNKRMIDVTAKGVDKARGVGVVAEAMQWPDGAIYTVGDGANDVPMLQRYHGFTVDGASADAVDAAERGCGNVAKLLSELSL